MDNARLCLVRAVAVRGESRTDERGFGKRVTELMSDGIMGMEEA